MPGLGDDHRSQVFFGRWTDLARTDIQVDSREVLRERSERRGSERPCGL